jgi:hypothetical protein
MLVERSRLLGIFILILGATCASANDLRIENWYGKKYENGARIAFWGGDEIEDLEGGRFGSSIAVHCNKQNSTCQYQILYGGCESEKIYPALFVSGQYRASITLQCKITDTKIGLKVGNLNIDSDGARMIENSNGYFEVAFRSRDDPERHLIKIAVAHTKGLKQIRHFLQN